MAAGESTRPMACGFVMSSGAESPRNPPASSRGVNAVITEAMSSGIPRFGLTGTHFRAPAPDVQRSRLDRRRRPQATSRTCLLSSAGIERTHPTHKRGLSQNEFHLPGLSDLGGPPAPKHKNGLWIERHLPKVKPPPYAYFLTLRNSSRGQKKSPKGAFHRPIKKVRYPHEAVHRLRPGI